MHIIHSIAVVAAAAAAAAAASSEVLKIEKKVAKSVFSCSTELEICDVFDKDIELQY